ncbi:MAG: acetyl-CoA carboxylase carboxyl transferase subunit alpha [Planctomycetota bacterium]|nr:MAG: acetyl-CoA carboxylase carboxyl transferase subunit alpha [Planctomycetota bacterium]
MAENNDNIDTGLQLPFEKPIARLQRQVIELQDEQVKTGRDYSSEVRQLRAQYISLLRKTYQALSPWETVQVARHPKRPLGRDYIDMIVKNFVELHGDRHFGDDQALVGGLGRIGTEKVLVLAHHKGRETKEKLACNFGCAQPEGYRKALRLMKLAEKFRLPVVALIDTQGAYPGIGSEERGVAEAIARNLLEMSRLRTPIVCVVIGEGGSGGALGIGVGDKVAILEYAYYSVISPEGCASILWRTGEKAPEAAQALKLTGGDLKKLGVVDDIIAEPLGGAHRNPAETAHNLEHYIVKTLRHLRRTETDELLTTRYETWRKKGKFVVGK